jgi:dihydropteroate synthase/2-amino-4-hydroxy-6-hydroxymethyldihydropteridine diphosphokinase
MATAYLALGSNLGDRAANLHAALAQVASFASVQATSFLYETPPAYLVDQPDFLNAVCRVQTSLPPHDLLAALKATETAVGRQPTVRYGPRTLDLDILFYDDLHLERPDLTIPHPRLAERGFVLQPLCDLDPALRHPVFGQTVGALWQALREALLPKVMPIGGKLWRWQARTYLMGILNATPDSFSGDGLWQYGEAAITQAVAQAQRLVAEGADCLDIGGLSTRPGHSLIGVDEEMARVLPILRAVVQAVDVPVSVDTFRPEVAQAALAAGAAMINDVWALRFDPALAALAAQAHVPLVLMDNRMQPADPAYAAAVQAGAHPPAQGDIVQAVRGELAAALDRAAAAALPRWLQVVDPGIGFGKTLAQHVALIRRLDELAASGYPLLFGPSRKSFIGRLLGDLPPDQRLEGTLSACVLAVARGANLVRIHDVQAVARAVRLADAVVHGIID